MTDEVMSEVSQTAAEARETIGRGIEQGRHRAGDLYDRAAHRARDIGHRGMQQYYIVRAQAQRNIVTTTVVAFAAGFLIARFLFRR